MAEDSYPDESRDVGDGPGVITGPEYEQLVSLIYPTGFVGLPTDSYPIFCDGTGLRAVKWRAGSKALVRGAIYLGDSVDVSESAAANSSGSTRYDLAVLRLDRSAAEAVRLRIVTGTTNPNGPAVTQTDTSNTSGVWEFPAGVIAVPNGAGALAAGALTKKLGYWLPRPSHYTSSTAGDPSNTKGAEKFEYDTGKGFRSNGTRWIEVFGDSGWIEAPLTSDWAAQVLTRRYNGIIYMQIGISRKGKTISNNNPVNVKIAQLDPQFYPSSFTRTTAYISGGAIGYITITSAGVVQLAAYAGITIATNAVVDGDDVSYIPLA